MATNPAVAIQQRDLEIKDEHVVPREALSLGERIKNALNNVFAGHEEFFGCTPD